MTEWPVHIEPNHRRVRALVDGVVIADTIGSIYLFETGLSEYVAFYWNKVDNWFEEDDDGERQDRPTTMRS